MNINTSHQVSMSEFAFVSLPRFESIRHINCLYEAADVLLTKARLLTSVVLFQSSY